MLLHSKYHDFHPKHTVCCRTENSTAQSNTKWSTLNGHCSCVMISQGFEDVEFCRENLHLLAGLIAFWDKNTRGTCSFQEMLHSYSCPFWFVELRKTHQKFHLQARLTLRTQFGSMIRSSIRTSRLYDLTGSVDTRALSFLRFGLARTLHSLIGETWIVEAYPSCYISSFQVLCHHVSACYLRCLGLEEPTWGQCRDGIHKAIEVWTEPKTF